MTYSNHYKMADDADFDEAAWEAAADAAFLNLPPSPQAVVDNDDANDIVFDEDYVPIGPINDGFT